MKKVFISSNKEIGQKCKSYAEKTLPSEFEITDDPTDCDIFISVLYDKILSNQFITSKKCYNFHPAILPEYAGVGTITWSLLNNEKVHGITLIKIDEGIDTGDVIVRRNFFIESNDTAETLTEKTMTNVFSLFKDTLIDLLVENYESTPQKMENRKIYSYNDLNNLLDLTQYMKATYFPGKPGPYFYDKKGNKINVQYD